MSQKYISARNEIEVFLKELGEVLTDPSFNLKTDLDILLKKRHESPIDPYTTENTLLALDFDRGDIKQQLLALDINEYIETFIDDQDSTAPPFFAFGKVIDNKAVYIKVKIRNRTKCKVFCVSFHFARYPLPTNRPYS